MDQVKKWAIDIKRHIIRISKVNKMKKLIKRIILVVIIIVIAMLYSYGKWEQAIYIQTAESGDNRITNPIIDTEEIRQKFVVPYNGLEEIKIKLLRNGSEEIKDYQWYLLDENGHTVQEGIIGEKELSQKSFVKKKLLYLEIERQNDSKGKTYTFVLKSNEATQNSCLSAYVTDKNQYASELIIKGTKSDDAMVLKMGIRRFNIETFLVFLGLVVYVVVFFRFIYKLFR